MVHPHDFSYLACQAFWQINQPSKGILTMTTVIEKPAFQTLDFASLEASVTQACKRIAPTWPLDQFIAVNPYWGFVEQPIAEVARQLGQLSGTAMVMPRSFYKAEWQAGRLTKADLQAAIDAAQTDCKVDELIDGLNADRQGPAKQPLLTTLADSQRDLSHSMAWVDFVTHQISQHCAAYFDVSQAAWNPERVGLYASWARQLANDHSTALLMGYSGFSRKAAALPQNPRELIAAATQALGLKSEHCTDYYTALLMSINGWASWCAYKRWQARLGTVPGQTDDDDLIELLAIRIGWEWLLLQDLKNTQLAPKWIAFYASNERAKASIDTENRNDWLLQNALELSYQQPLCKGLMNAPTVVSPTTVQAIFCIDLRSEVFRRALEASSATVQTRGFAGFFGLFISYSPTGTALTRPQLPGLLASSRCVTDECDSPSLGEVIAKKRKQGLQWRSTLQTFRSTASSGFSFVETCGMLYAGKLLKNTLPSYATPHTVEQTGLTDDEVLATRPRLQNLPGISPEAELQSRCNMAAGILGAIGVTKDFARIVLLAGHGSQTANNPHAAGLDCGACGGQTGEVNARALAALLNDVSVRAALMSKNIAIPDTTWFLGGMHNTTTDSLALYDTDLLPASHSNDLIGLNAALAKAGQRARAERAPALGLAHLAKDDAQLALSIKSRANDWAQVRPEWGLANNAAFIVAPRQRSQHLNLAGRAFLHDYDYAADPTLGVLELIMTAPMVVTNWINMQYYASVVDNAKYGSGNKVLHNVVGGRLGVFEGNGGDLRIGLPMQSLHDGSQWQHTPLRLSVFIQAPQGAIDSIIAKHEVVKHLIDNQWLHLFQIEVQADRPESVSSVNRRTKRGWFLEKC
jgi:uncharacterized protein YbcC (UPF0753/DUF2309 family)